MTRKIQFSIKTFIVVYTSHVGRMFSRCVQLMCVPTKCNSILHIMVSTVDYTKAIIRCHVLGYHIMVLPHLRDIIGR